jgi:hypothetical protein
MHRNETLAQFHAMLGNPKEERERIKAKVKNIVKKLGNSNLTRDQSYQGLHRVFLPSITYGVGTTT